MYTYPGINKTSVQTLSKIPNKTYLNPKFLKIQELKSLQLNESTKNIIDFPAECQHVKVQAKVGI